MEHLSGNFYIVQPGDTLGQIATVIYGTSRRWQDLASANSLEANTPIFPGDVLRYPADSASESFESAYKNLPRSKVVVQKGDTLELIAERQLGNKAFWKLVWRWNESIIAEPNRIFEGQSLDYIAAEELTALLSDRKGLKSAH
jgi:nucleoid-associated protein YgaU